MVEFIVWLSLILLTQQGRLAVAKICPNQGSGGIGQRTCLGSMMSESGKILREMVTQ